MAYKNARSIYRAFLDIFVLVFFCPTIQFAARELGENDAPIAYDNNRPLPIELYRVTCGTLKLLWRDNDSLYRVA